jgi:hypothetical protein
VFKQTGVDFMKTQTSSGLVLTLTLTAALVLAARTVPAQNTTNATASAGQTAPLLSYGVNQIIQLSQAKVADATIINYIQNSGSSYGLDANQIVYLKQQGVSDTIINIMLNQPRPSPTAAQSATATATSTATATVNVMTQPEAPSFYVDPIYVTSSSVYVIPDTQTYMYNAHTYQPYYGGRSYLGYRPDKYYCQGTHYSFGAGYGGGRGGGGHYRGGWHH